MTAFKENDRVTVKGYGYGWDGLSGKVITQFGVLSTVKFDNGQSGAFLEKHLIPEANAEPVAETSVLSLGDKVRVTGYADPKTSKWEGREGVLSKDYGDGYWVVTFADGCEKVWSLGSFYVKYLTKIDPDFTVGQTVKVNDNHPYKGKVGIVRSVRTYAAPNSTEYHVEIENSALRGVKGMYLTAHAETGEKAKPEHKFAEGQKVRYTGDGDGVYAHYQKDGTVTGYSFSGNVIVRIDEEPHGTVLHRETDVEALPTEGQEIKPEDLKVGMEIRTEYVSEKGTYRQVSSKQGTITHLRDGWHDEKYPYTQDDKGSDIALFFSGIKATHILVKDAPKVDPLVEQVAKLGTGSVVQFEAEDGSVYTYVKTSKDGEWFGLTGTMTPLKVYNDTIKQALEVPSGKILVSK